jgi:hypothetical protein
MTFLYMLLCRQYAVKLLVIASNLSNILLPELEIRLDISQSISLQKCIQIADILSLLLLHKYLLPKCKKNLKKRRNVVPIACTYVRHLFDICKAKKTCAGP